MHKQIHTAVRRPRSFRSRKMLIRSTSSPPARRSRVVGASDLCLGDRCRARSTYCIAGIYGAANGTTTYMYCTSPPGARTRRGNGRCQKGDSKNQTRSDEKPRKWGENSVTLGPRRCPLGSLSCLTSSTAPQDRTRCAPVFKLLFPVQRLAHPRHM